MQFWKNVTKLLDERRLSLRMLAKEIGVSPTSLSNYAKGAVPGLDVAVKIANYFGVSLDALVSESLARPPTMCPAPEEHEFLHEFVDKLGLNELLALSRVGSQSAAWKLADILAAGYPASFTLDELKARLDLDEPLLEASLLALRRRRAIVELSDASGLRYRWREPVAHFLAQEAGDIAMHMTRAMQIMLREVLPAVDRRDGSGHLITIAAKVPPELAREMADKLKELIKEEGRNYTAQTGATEVHLVFGVAVGQEDRYTQAESLNRN
jgi:transcriptional regulator with XRE-family HTH domain